MASNILPSLHRFVDFINSGDANIGQEVVSDAAIFHVPFGGEPLKGLSGYLQILGMMRGAFSDIQWTLEETVCEGDKIVARFETRGTHDGQFMNVPASGKKICMTAVNIYQFVDGKIVEERGQPDLFGLMMQIGALPGPPS
ncbi:NTF2-like protein [Phaeosphaeriaceae sp. SRC1lsM3a]|nr:NTF2-like protein [Stagonospora sp. SRC1lsM3a]